MIPKIIWSFWHDEAVPDIVRFCMKTWQYHNPEYEIRMLHLSSVISGLVVPELRHIDSHQRLSDYIRLHVLAEHGGVWMDASIACRQSLEWMLSCATDSVECLSFCSPSYMTDIRFPTVECWFIACPSQSRFIMEWRNEMMRMEQFESVDAYVLDVQRSGVNTQNIGKFCNYLAIYVAAQVVAQSRTSLGEPVEMMLWDVSDAEHGPLKHVTDEGFVCDAGEWDSELVLRKLCDMNQSRTSLVKLCRGDRNVLDSDPELFRCFTNSFRA
jgi:hypothetical protein